MCVIALRLYELFRPEDEFFSRRHRSQVQIYRLLSLLGPILLLVHGAVHRTANPGTHDPLWLRLSFVGVLLLLFFASTFSASVRRWYVEVSWGVLGTVMAWTVTLATLNQFSGEYSLSVLFVYALFGGIVILGADSMAPVLSFLAVGLALLGAGVWAAPVLETSPLVLGSGMVDLALFETAAHWWGLSMRESLKTQQDDLRRSRDQQRQMIEQLPMEMAIFDPEARFQYVNEQAVGDPAVREQLVGHTNEEYYRRRNLDVEVGRKRDESIREVVQTKEVDRVQETMHTEQGPRHYLRIHVPITDSDGEVRKVVGCGVDITERKEREQASRRRQEKVRALYEATGQLLRSGSQKEVSDRIHWVLKKVFDYPFAHTGFLEDGMIVPERTESASGLSLPVPEARSPSSNMVAGRALQSGEAVVTENIQSLENPIDYGDLRSAASVPIGGHGAIVVGKAEEATYGQFDLHLLEMLGGYAALILDRLRREADLRDTKEEAEEASRLKSTMLANMSHEIRTPLTSIIGFSEAIEEKADLLESSPQDTNLSTLSRFAYLIGKNGRRLLNTLDSVLNLSRLEADRMDLATERVSLDELATSLVEELYPQADEAGVHCEVEVASCPVVAQVDQGGMQVALQNLISNAITYTEEGGRVRVRSYRAEGDAVVEVEDTGIGMDEDTVERVFEPFRQASEGLNREYEGTGLGLSITKQIVEKMSGDIEVDTEEDAGTCIRLRLPQADPEEDAAGSPPGDGQ
ncbi:PAS domain-containing sensor histidine kinase [Salinibacter grassmerensis]|uniref:PAS domain-containing sensor histidine kinase n=1 Tax=Salinibacter grassmerensis TaxID=3040353 RepID=UPI0021E95BD6|nr:PAS domain-containing sensor histidine kinase [Salinibacter grassmerensis]